MNFIWPIFFNFANTKYLFLLICVIYAKGNEALVNSDYARVCFTISNLLRMLPRCFLCFHCSNFKIFFDRKIFEKKLLFFYLLPNFYFLAKYYVLVTVGSKMAILQEITKIYKKTFFACLVYLN